MDNKRLQFLFENYINKTESPAEQAELMAFIADEKNKIEIERMLDDARLNFADSAKLTNEQSDRLLKAILTAGPQSLKAKPKIRTMLAWKWVAAAAILFFIAASYLMLDSKNTTSNNTITKVINKDINPGSFKARLTLADGTVILLDSLPEGELAKQGNTNIISNKKELAYKAQSEVPQENIYNTIATNKAETFSFTLADGSKVWLNAASSIRFPVSFPGKERQVLITGEAYIKVAKNPAQPFIATANNMDILALGTQFNVNAYEDEGFTSATLIEGKVKVSISGNENAVLLNPGQQTKTAGNGKLTPANSVDTDRITGWKEGLFDFDNANLKTILNEFARWYDVEIVYEGNLKNRKFFGMVNRSSSLLQVLELLQDNDIKFRIDGKKLIVKSE